MTEQTEITEQTEHNQEKLRLFRYFRLFRYPAFFLSLMPLASRGTPNDTEFLLSFRLKCEHTANQRKM